MNIRKNDIVKVMCGNFSGKTGRVIKVINNENRIIVEGVNLVKRHTKPSQDNPQGGIMEKEAPINRSNVALMYKNKVSRIGYKFLDNGKKVRFLKNTKEVVD